MALQSLQFTLYIQTEKRTRVEALDKIDFIITVCEADMSLSSQERERLCGLISHLIEKNNRYLLAEVPPSLQVNDPLEILGFIKDKTDKVSKTMDKADYNGNPSFRSDSCIQSLANTDLDEYSFWIGFCYLVLAADHSEDPIGKKLEEAELLCLKKIITANQELAGRKFVSIVNDSVKAFKRFL